MTRGKILLWCSLKLHLKFPIPNRQPLFININIFYYRSAILNQGITTPLRLYYLLTNVLFIYNLDIIHVCIIIYLFLIYIICLCLISIIYKRTFFGLTFINVEEAEISVIDWWVPLDERGKST